MKKERRSKKNKSFHFPFFYGTEKKFHQLWANPVEIENISFNLIEQSYCVYRRDIRVT